MARVLCISREDFPEEWIAEMVADAVPESVIYDRFAQARTTWMPRFEAEITPLYKQLIPYTVIRADAGNWIGCYRRNGSETRLHDLWSCGVGGHVNPIDAEATRGHLKEIVDRGLDRELTEEIPRRPAGGCRPVFRGIINEEKTRVGTVHFGLVYTVAVTDPELLTAGKELNGFTWISAQTVRQLNLELWSLLSLDLIGIS
ncbi:MAG: phosphoesterase [Pseudomonadota bacterium]